MLGLMATCVGGLDCCEEADCPGPGRGTKLFAMGLNVNSLALGFNLDLDATASLDSSGEALGSFASFTSDGGLPSLS